MDQDYACGKGRKLFKTLSEKEKMLPAFSPFSYSDFYFNRELQLICINHVIVVCKCIQSSLYQTTKFSIILDNEMGDQVDWKKTN